MRRLLVLAGVVAFSFPAIAQNTLTRVTPDALTWKENPAFPKGVQIATLVGDPTKAGDVVVLRIKFPANFQMPPHTHPYSEVVTIISGSIGTSHGEKFEKKGELLKPGARYGSIPRSTLTTLGPEIRKAFCKFSLSVLEASITSTRRTIHARSNKSKPRNERNLPPPILRSWRVIVICSKGEYLGSVEAADRDRAEAVAIKQFDLDQDQRSRLLIRERL